MKTILLISFGAFISNIATTHPNLFYLALSILAGFILALLVAMVFVGPTPKPPMEQTPVKRQANVTQAARKAAKRQPKKQSQMQYGIEIFNYPTTQGAYA